MSIDRIAEKIIIFYEKISSWEQSVVKGSGISTNQMHALEIIGRNKAMRMKDMAEKMGITTGSLTVTIDRLEKQGMLKRVPHAHDRRSYMIELTPKGEKHFLQHSQYHLDFTHEIVTTLDEKELEILENVLDKISSQI
jgi:DNA-binding MarR family transcriptional regulator